MKKTISFIPSEPETFQGKDGPPGSFRQSHFVTCPAAQKVRERMKARG